MTEKEDAIQKPADEPLDDETLEKLAVEELMREAIQGAARAELVGPSGWVRAQPKTNKRFLVNTIRHAVNSNKYHASRSVERSSHRQTKKSPKRDRHPVPTIKKDRSRKL